MGKGDKKTRRGKITNSSYGVTRPRKSKVKITPKKSDMKAAAVKKNKSRTTAKKD